MKSEEYYDILDYWEVSLVRRAINSGLIDKDEANSKELRDSAKRVATEIAETYAGTGEGMGSSDVTAFLHDMLDDVRGIEVGYEGRQLRRFSSKDDFNYLMKIVKRVIKAHKEEGLDYSDFKDAILDQDWKDRLFRDMAKARHISPSELDFIANLYSFRITDIGKFRMAKSPEKEKLKKTYGKGLTKKEKEIALREMKTKGKLDEDNPEAYEEWDSDKKYKERGKTTKPSKYTEKYKEKYGSNVTKALKNKSKDSGIDYGTLKKVYDRGLAAWRTGHRPGVTPHQWAMGRVNSFIIGGKTRTTADKDLWEGRKKTKKSHIASDDLDLTAEIEMLASELSEIEASVFGEEYDYDEEDEFPRGLGVKPLKSLYVENTKKATKVIARAAKQAGFKIKKPEIQNTGNTAPSLYPNPDMGGKYRMRLIRGVIQLYVGRKFKGFIKVEIDRDNSDNVEVKLFKEDEYFRFGGKPWKTYDSLMKANKGLKDLRSEIMEEEVEAKSKSRSRSRGLLPKFAMADEILELISEDTDEQNG